MNECPCGLNSPFTDCCAPLIRGAVLPDTAEDLMRSRYTAYVVKNWDYLTATVLPEERRPGMAKAYALGQEDIQWMQLEILGLKNGGREDGEGEVTFAARYLEKGAGKTLSETSRFVKENGRWYYSEKRSVKSAVRQAAPSSKPIVRPGEKVGRNDPRPCRSGKKHKKCCGK